MARFGSFVAGLGRARASVRVRVTLLAAGAFAVTLFAAATILLNSLEDSLVGDLRSDSEAALDQQLTLIGEQGLPMSMISLRAEDGSYAYNAMGQNFAFALPPGMTPDEFDEALQSGSVAALPTAAGLQQQAINDAATVVGANTTDVFATSGLIGPGALAIASPLDAVRDTINTTTRLLWIVGPALVALVAGLAWVLASRALRPVRLLTSRVAAIESRSLHERVPEPGSNDEISVLARTMNEMLGRLDTANESSKRLVSDASHELRTPIAVMRTELEVAQRDTTNDWDETGGVLLGELDRLALLVDDLLLLARGQERELARSRVELVDLAHDAGSRRRRPDIAVDVLVPGDTSAAVISGDRVAIERAVDHLVANAARSARTRVVVTVEGTTIHVDDDGSGIPAEHRASVVQRFVRLDEGRSRDSGGAGLGLAVASDVAALHGGRLEIGDSPIGGARVSLVLGRYSPPRVGAGSATMES